MTLSYGTHNLNRVRLLEASLKVCITPAGQGPQIVMVARLHAVVAFSFEERVDGTAHLQAPQPALALRDTFKRSISLLCVTKSASPRKDASNASPEHYRPCNRETVMHNYLPSKDSPHLSISATHNNLGFRERVMHARMLLGRRQRLCKGEFGCIGSRLGET